MIRGLAAAAVVAGALVVPFGASDAAAASGEPVVTLQPGVNECNGVVTTPGSANTNKRLVAGDLEPGGTVTFEISYPVDPSDVGQTFQITDCVFIDGTAALKYTVDFVPNNTNFLLSFQLTIPPTAPIGAEYCNYAKTTRSPSASPASNRKAGPACFHVGGDLRIIKEAAGDATHAPLAGASFTVSCPTTVTVPPVVISGLSGATTYSGGAYQATGTSATGVIAIAGPAGTPCTVTETAPPPGYELPADSTFHYTVPLGSSQQVNYIDDPRTKNTTTLTTEATSATVGGSISDTATLSGATADAGGTITFHVYGPSETAVCTGTAVFTDTVDVAGNGDYLSADFTPTTAGPYYWIADYSGDNNNLTSGDACGARGETSTIGRRTTLVATAASSETLGATVDDTATLSGATADAGGTITFHLYGPSESADCTGTPVFTDSVDVAGNGDYLSGGFAPTAAGSYYWTAAYSGDANNLPADEPCGAHGETSVLAKLTTGVVTAATSGAVGDAVHDTATLSGAGAQAGGTVTFHLYGPSESADCTGTPVFTDSVDVAGNGDYLSGGFAPTAAGSYYWTASYSGDPNNLPADEPCGADGETSLVGQLSPAVTTVATSASLGAGIHDTATLSGATNDASGTLTFNLYGPDDSACTGDPAFTSDPIAVSGNGKYESGAFVPTVGGDYNWTAHYSGDRNNAPADEVCGSPNETSSLDFAAVSTSSPPPPPGSSPPPPAPSPAHSPQVEATSLTGSPVRAELELVALLLGAGALMLLLARRRRPTR